MNSYTINPCAVIPVYNHEQAIGAMVKAVIAHDLHCILVDDGSSAACANVLDNLTATFPNHLRLLRHNINRGKGCAVLTGFQEAAKLGYSHALQIDADGQHLAADIPKFLSAANQYPEAVIIGYPIYDESVPKHRFYARYLTHVWIWINTLSLDIKDSMCGFRVYPLAPVIALAQRKKLRKRMDFDSEILVRLHWQGTKMINVPTRVVYPSDGISHFRLLHDNVLISCMHATLFMGMLWRLPFLLTRNLRNILRKKEP